MPKIEKMSKGSLREEFGKHYQKYYSTKLFEEEDFKRRKCKECGRGFWSATERDKCGDHEPYSFFKDKPAKMSYEGMWKKLADFLKKNKHEEVSRYPVVSRWRKDLYFTIAGIQDFQRVEDGKMNFEYPANPLIVPQFCLRFSDIENVGVTGRHFTGFMMANQTAFDYPKHGYWRDRTIDLNYHFLVDVLGVKKDELLYHEDVWAMGDFSEFGPSLESFANGLELVNSVFTQFETSNNIVKELEGKVVDVGWGVNRLLWFYTGYDTAYRAVFSGVMDKIRNRVGVDLDDSAFRKFAAVAGELDITEVKDVRARELLLLKKIGMSEKVYNEKVRPLQAVYATLDHVRTLLFAINDGALPSNIGGGYNLRVLLRRALSLKEKYKLDLDINELAKLEAEDLKGVYPELTKNLDEFYKIIDVETERYRKTKETAGKIIDNMLAKNKKVDSKELRMLYESYGITPEMISEEAMKKSTKIELPENLYEGIIEGDFAKKEKEHKVDIALPKLPKTEPLYYDNFATEAKAKVLFAHKNYLVLDKTPFYPESGGQLADHGEINNSKVKDVQKSGDVIVHIMEGDVDRTKGFEIGATVEAKVNQDRRRRLMVHHTSTHLVNACAREVLGKHVWQEGTTKDYNKSRIDISHYDKVTDEQIKQIEKKMNEYIQNGVKVELHEMNRGDAERKYGFTIYQGHGTPAKTMRIVTISTKEGKLIDAEACGGLHAVGRESRIGLVKIISSTKVHDGVTRFEFVAGPAALEYFQREDSELTKIAQEMNVERLKSADAVLAAREDYRSLYKKLDQYEEVVGKIIAEQFAGKDSIEENLGRAPRELMRSIAATIIDRNKKAVVLLTNSSGDVVCMVGEGSPKIAIDFAKEKLAGRDFRGGGSKKVAEGRLGK